MVYRQKRRVKISGTAWGLLGCVVIGFLCGKEEGGLWLCLLPAIGIHEMGHMLVAWLCGAHIGGMKLDLFGARLSIGGMVSYRKEFLIALGGPLANILTVIVGYGLWGDGILLEGGGRSIFFVASLGLAVFNLLPIGTMDGGRMLTTVLCRFGSPTVAYVVLKVTTAMFLFVLWLISTYALLMGSGMLTLFVFSLCLLVRLLSSDPSTAEI